VNGFCPDGYLPAQEAIARAAECWFPERVAAIGEGFAALERLVAPQSETKQPSDNSLDALARAFSQSQIPAAWQDDMWRHEFKDLWSQTAHRLRNFLHQGTLKAYYFKDDGCHNLSREFWATGKADGVIESGTYWPLRAPTHLYEQRPNHSLFVKQSELDTLLSVQPAKKRPLPESKLPELVAAMRTHNDKPNRKEQREAVRKLPEFEGYHLTDAVFREAERQVPRDAGRKSPRPEK
jgi:hypothetical protein